MKDSRPKIDELLIDELVSGQLTGERYRAALLAFEAEPAKWRDCALAFLEEQALRSELRELARGTINWSEVDCLEGAAVDGAASVVTDPHPTGQNNLVSLQFKQQWSSSFRTILSTTALLLVSFTVGWLGSEVLAERQRTMLESRLNSVVQNSTEVRPQNSPKIEPEFVVDRPGSFDRGIPSSIRELERNGRVSVKTYDMLVPTTLKDGSPAYVPVQQMILSRGSVESY